MDAQNSNRARRTTRTPLAPAELARVRQVARRLKAELDSVLRSLSIRHHSAGQMAQDLKVNRTICHRLLTAIDSAKDEFSLVIALPGVQGLRQCIHAMERRGADASRVSAAEAAVEQFHQLVRDLGGSHSRLSTRLQLSTPTSAAVPSPGAPARRRLLRQQLFESASALMGRRIEARCGLSLLRPNPANARELEYVHVRLFTGIEASPTAIPLVVGTSIVSVESGDEQAMNAFCTLDGAPIGGRAQNAILTAFSSDPLPLVTTRDLSSRLVHVIDPRVAESRRRLDVAIGYRLPALCAVPSRQDVPVLLEALHIREPTDALVFDVYLHADLAAGCRPSIDAYVGRSGGLCDLIDRWYDRLDGSPVLKLLGAGLANAPTPMAPRFHELAEHVFDRVGWNPAEFVGYRCEEQYPLWGYDYVMAFDYRVETPALSPPTPK